MLACGTTTVEIKTGYGLDTETELRMLEVIAELDKIHAVTIVPTFLAAHAVPPEYKGNSEKYETMLRKTQSDIFNKKVKIKNKREELALIGLKTGKIKINDFFFHE